jgi:hypothetical protein
LNPKLTAVLNISPGGILPVPHVDYQPGNRPTSTSQSIGKSLFNSFILQKAFGNTNIMHNQTSGSQIPNGKQQFSKTNHSIRMNNTSGFSGGMGAAGSH